MSLRELFQKLLSYELWYQENKNNFQCENKENLVGIETQLRKIFFTGKVEKLFEEVEKRRAAREKIRAGLRELGRTCYGVADLPGVMDWLYPQGDEVRLYMARGVKTLTLEQLSVALLTRALNEHGGNFRYNTFTFYGDTCGDNSHKRAWCNELRGLKKMQILSQKLDFGEETCGKTMESLRFARDMELWGGLCGVSKGQSLKDFHEGIWAQAMQNFCPKSLDKSSVDIENFFQFCLKKSLEKWHEFLPSHFFLAGKNGVEKVKKEVLHYGNLGRVRPPSYWYYPLDLAFYADGTRILLAHRDEPTDRFGAYFAYASKIIEEATGFAPLILELPEEFEHLNIQEIPLACLADSAWSERIKTPTHTRNVTELLASFIWQMTAL